MPARPSIAPRSQQLLAAWRRGQKHGLTPGQLLVLADVIEHAGTPPASMHARARRLHMSQPHVRAADLHLEAQGLITRQRITSPAPHLHRSYPSIAAIPTRRAFRLFGQWRKIPTTHHHARPV